MDLRSHDESAVTNDTATGTDGVDFAVLTYMRELQGDGEDDFVGELIEVFLADAKPRVAAIRAAVARGDREALRSVAHSLKGSSANLGASGLAELCAGLERRAKSGSLEGADREASQLEAEFERVRRSLEMARSSRQQPSG